MRGFKNNSLHMLVLAEVLGLELSNFSRQLKLKSGIDDDHWAHNDSDSRTYDGDTIAGSSYKNDRRHRRKNSYRNCIV